MPHCVSCRRYFAHGGHKYTRCKECRYRGATPHRSTGTTVVHSKPQTSTHTVVHHHAPPPTVTHVHHPPPMQPMQPMPPAPVPMMPGLQPPVMPPMQPTPVPMMPGLQPPPGMHQTTTTYTQPGYNPYY
eukprot:TRINITY_DN12905_c0_g1_i1.p1 TRINITY_DN12905_c0_g1~~TRINITY_DN12905_c0_g1_i1.p1  ORF type:complete len:129 (-),score=3.85 TRINITY_DN12905_c0_g1_i1:28-414(-)